MKELLENLTAEWEHFCYTHNLPQQSADEILYEFDAILSDWQKGYIKSFINRWEMVKND